MIQPLDKIFGGIPAGSLNLPPPQSGITFGPEEVGKTIPRVKNGIQSTPGNIKDHLNSFGQQRWKEKNGKTAKRLERSSRRLSG
jgi:hypothetical protein